MVDLSEFNICHMCSLRRILRIKRQIYIAARNILEMNQFSRMSVEKSLRQQIKNRAQKKRICKPNDKHKNVLL